MTSPTLDSTNTVPTLPELPESIRAVPEPSLHHMVESFHMRDGKHLRDVRLQFSPRMNVIIGARGSGKSTLLQNMRYSFGAVATGPRAARNEEMVRGTLLHGTVVSRVRTKHGVGYGALRKWGEAPLVTDEHGKPVALSLDSELFRVEVYSQKEIESMVDSLPAQRALIDKFAEAEIRDHNLAIAGVHRLLTQNGAALVRLDMDIEELTGRTSDLPSVTAAIAALATAGGPDAADVRRAQGARVTRGREAAVMNGAAQEVKATRARLDSFEQEATRRLGMELPAGLAESPNRELLERAHAAMRSAREAVASAVAQARGTLTDAETGLLAAVDALALAHAAQGSADERLTREHDADVGRVAERERLQRRLLDLEELEKRLRERQREQQTQCARRAELRAERDRLVAERYAVRVRVTEELSEALDDIHVGIGSAGDRTDYVELLAELAKGSHLRVEFLREVARHLRPAELVQIALQNDPGPIDALDDAKTARSDRAMRLLAALRASGRLFELDTVDVADAPLLMLKVHGKFKPSHEVSAGQACTIVLSILLLQSDAPLLIDEPENCLDNSFIYDVLVPTLLRIKKHRQLIFVTHNPCVTVLAEADRVFVMDETEGVGRVVEAGTVDEVQGSIERLQEGGRAAFVERGRRYGHRVESAVLP